MNRSALALEQFTRITARAVAQDGLHELRPTACFPLRREITVLEGLSDDADVEASAMSWASSRVEGDEEFLLAYRVDADHFKVLRRREGRTEGRVYRVRSRRSTREEG